MISINFNTEVDVNKTKQIISEIENDERGGWFSLPRNTDVLEIARIKETAKKIQEEADYLVCIGIGGSYLGHRAIIEALRPKSPTKIIYAGNSLSERELNHTLDEIGDDDFSVLVISKSGTTLEPARAFVAFKKKLTEKYGAEGAVERIYVTTDASKGMLHDEAATVGYTKFVIPENVGGRYSVLTAVGLLPLAVAGIDIDELLAGASQAMIQNVQVNPDVKESIDENAIIMNNPSVQYAWMRYSLAVKRYDTEVFASFEPCTMYFNEWLKQLFGESEGKNKQGIFPASVIYSTDLHSMGQFMQDGRRNLWETIIDYPTDETNEKVVKAVQVAHTNGGIPVFNIKVSSFDERGFGELIYFFELACAISAKLFGVNPFDQPGVEAYKAELMKLL